MSADRLTIEIGGAEALHCEIPTDIASELQSQYIRSLEVAPHYSRETFLADILRAGLAQNRCAIAHASHMIRGAV